MTYPTTIMVYPYTCYNISCPKCKVVGGKPCVSRSKAVGVCVLKRPHAARSKAYWRNFRGNGSVYEYQNIASGFGNDDRLMEQALDMEEEVMASKAVLEAQAERILKKLQVLERLGEDVYDNDSVLLFRFRYNDTSSAYTFAALKAAGMWFLTGARNNGSYKSWDELVDFFTSKGEVVEMWMATDWENVLG